MLTSTYLPLVGGVEMVVHNLATALTYLGHNVYVVTHYNKNRKFEEHYNYKIIRFGFKGYGRLKLTLPLVIMTLASAVKRFHIDVINIHNVYKPGIWAYNFWHFYKKIPIVGTPHGDDVQITPEIGDGVRLNPKLNRIVKRNIDICTRLISISPSMRQDLEELVVDAKKIMDVPNGIWVNKFKTNIDKDKTREKLGIPINSTVLVSVGRNHPRKGFEYGLEAVAKLRNEGAELIYIIIGRNQEPLIKKAHSLGISDFCITPGELKATAVSEFLQASDIYVSPSIVESFGLTTLEAMGAGLPCIVTNVSGSRDLVSNEHGVIVEPANSMKLSKAIKLLIENKSLRIEMGSKARKEALNYDWPKVAKKYIDVYREAISANLNDQRIAKTIPQ
jgi:glycosyltransferase involved in cell wall biosynthesis